LVELAELALAQLAELLDGLRFLGMAHLQIMVRVRRVLLRV
jgi:hypothetical protein